MGHSTYSPSATKREYLCPPSHRHNRDQPRRRSMFSDEGTAAHHVHELCLRTNRDVDTFAGCHIAVNGHGKCTFLHEKRQLKRDEVEFEVTDEMVVAVQQSVDWCRELPGRHYVEVKVEHTRWCPKVYDKNGEIERQFGTADHIALDFKRKVIYVTDLKYGQGEQVFAEENMQAMKYALGAYDEFREFGEFERVVIRISQPRLKHFDVWEITIDELLAWGKKMRKRLQLTLDDSAEYHASEEACRFCGHAADCKELARVTNETRALDFDDLTVKAPNTPKAKKKAAKLPSLSVKEMVRFWRLWPLIQLRYKAVEAELAARENDEPGSVPGLKHVEAITRRKWAADDDEIRAALMALGIPRHKIDKVTLASPNQIEEVLPKEKHEELKQLWVKPRGEPTLVDVSDKRERYSEKRAKEHAEAFDDLDK
jgi:hypothetical protein